jgi:hypothetical protein
VNIGLGDERRARARHDEPMTGLACKIIVQGEIGEHLANAFPEFTLRRASGRTEFSGTVADHAQLQHVLDQLFDLGMMIVSLTTGKEAGPRPS